MKKFSGGKTLAVVAVAGGAILASIAPVMADVSAQSPSTSLVRIESPGKLKALGAAIEIDVTYSCPSSQPQAYLYVNVSQTVIAGVASGTASKNVTCTGGFETVKVSVTAQGRSFHPFSKAYAKADLSAWPNSASDEREIDLRY
jgi:hypothetical protein